jgi:hypothetical protein
MPQTLGVACTPKSSNLIGFSRINHPFWGIPIYGQPYILAVKKRLSGWSFLQPLGHQHRHCYGGFGGEGDCQDRHFLRSWRICSPTQPPKKTNTYVKSCSTNIAMYTFLLFWGSYYSWTCSHGIWDMKWKTWSNWWFHHPQKVWIT